MTDDEILAACDPAVFERAAESILYLAVKGMCGAVIFSCTNYTVGDKPEMVALRGWLGADGDQWRDGRRKTYWGNSLGVEGRATALLLMAELARDARERSNA